MNHVMIDLETLGTGNSAPIATIGAVFFEPSTGCTGARFYSRVDFATDMVNGAVPDGGALKWWLRQPADARAELIADDAEPIQYELGELSTWMAGNAVPADLNQLQVWGNGASFDPVLLRAAYDRAYLLAPWHYRNERDVRTMVELGRAIGFDPKRDLPFHGVRHNALDDAVHQALVVSHIWQHLTVRQEDLA